MKKYIMLIITALFLTMMTAYNCFAANSVPIAVTASVPVKADGVSASISKIDGGLLCTPGDDTWTPGQSSIAFGNLGWNTEFNIFLSNYYFAVDVGVVDNSGNVWTLTHTRTNFQNFAGTANLNNNVNVTFVKQTSSTTGTDLSKVSYQNSNNVSYTKTALTPGWLRIYYGIGTGNTDAGCPTDATGVSPIGLDKPAGTYTGQVTLTLTGV